MNAVILSGNLATDPECRRVGDGTAVCSFRLAVQRDFKNGDGKRDADFVTVVAWRKLAELCGQYIGKGCKVIVFGRLNCRSYEKDGTRHYATDVVADKIEFLSFKKDMQQGQQQDDGYGGYDVPIGQEAAAGYAYLYGDDADLPY